MTAMATENYTYPMGNPERDEARLLKMVGEHESKRVMRAGLKEVEDLIIGDRHTDYGPPEINHGRTAQLYTIYLGVPITPRQVNVMNMLQKISRDANLPKHDSMIDIAGYALNAIACEAAAAVNGT